MAVSRATSPSKVQKIWEHYEADDSRFLLKIWACSHGTASRKTVNAEWYINTCLPKVLEAWCVKHPRASTRRLLLHHDNASAHTAAATFDYLQENGVQHVTHPPYYPDLAPCDFFLFPAIKKELKGKPFETVEDARAFVEDQISGMGQSEWAGAVDSWFRRMGKCIHADGEYFEHLS